MGFNLYNLGVIRECWLDNGTLKYKSPTTGKISECFTDLEVSTAPQTNIFYSKTVAFYLTDEEHAYIGRYDGKVSVYDKETFVLTGLRNWNVPPHPVTRVCGYIKPIGAVYEVVLDLQDRQSLYCGYHNIEAKLIAPAPDTLDISYAVAMCQSSPASEDFHIYREGGVLCGTEFRTVQDKLWKQDCPRFL